MNREHACRVSGTNQLSVAEKLVEGREKQVILPVSRVALLRYTDKVAEEISNKAVCHLSWSENKYRMNSSHVTNSILVCIHLENIFTLVMFSTSSPP